MDANLTEIEIEVLGSDSLDLARGALVASGIASQRKLDRYVSKVEQLCKQLPSTAALPTDADRARALFDWLWATKPNRNQSGGKFRLTQVIDAQLDADALEVGNCLGLTLLYNILGVTLALNVRAVYLEAVSGRLSHVISCLKTGPVSVDIDNTFPHGFDLKDYLDNPYRTDWGHPELIADVYHSIGWELHENGELQAAIHNYTKAIWLNPSYEKAYLNRGIALSMLGRDDEAKGDLEVGQYRPPD
jgi:tetratricopeptide (TPR) repeat protein